MYASLKRRRLTSRSSMWSPTSRPRRRPRGRRYLSVRTTCPVLCTTLPSQRMGKCMERLPHNGWEKQLSPVSQWCDSHCHCRFHSVTTVIVTSSVRIPHSVAVESLYYIITYVAPSRCVLLSLSPCASSRKSSIVNRRFQIACSMTGKQKIRLTNQMHSFVQHHWVHQIWLVSLVSPLRSWDKRPEINCTVLQAEPVTVFIWLSQKDILLIKLLIWSTVQCML